MGNQLVGRQGRFAQVARHHRQPRTSTSPTSRSAIAVGCAARRGDPDLHARDGLTEHGLFAHDSLTLGPGVGSRRRAAPSRAPEPIPHSWIRPGRTRGHSAALSKPKRGHLVGEPPCAVAVDGFTAVEREPQCPQVDTVDQPAYLPTRLKAMLGAAVIDERLSLSHCTQLNGDAENEVVGACQRSPPPRAHR